MQTRDPSVRNCHKHVISQLNIDLLAVAHLHQCFALLHRMAQDTGAAKVKKRNIPETAPAKSFQNNIFEYIYRARRSIRLSYISFVAETVSPSWRPDLSVMFLAVTLQRMQCTDRKRNYPHTQLSGTRIEVYACKVTVLHSSNSSMSIVNAL